MLTTRDCRILAAILRAGRLSTHEIAERMDGADRSEKARLAIQIGRLQELLLVRRWPGSKPALWEITNKGAEALEEAVGRRL